MSPVFSFIPLPVFVFILAFVISAMSGLFLIPLLQRLKMGQVVREDGLKSHYKKNGTPTMGGLIFLLPLVLVGIPLVLLGYPILSFIMVTLACGAVGFADDWLKVVKKHNKGISGKQKMLSLGIIAALFVLWTVLDKTQMNAIVIPFVGVTKPFLVPLWLAAGFSVFIFLAFTNGVNLTDGVDGLAGSTVLVAVTAFGVIFSFGVAFDGLRLFCALLAGGILGYLLYNLHPAKVFMGDTGSLPLGGALAALAIASGMPLILILLGGVFVLEDLSVMLQVFWFKRTGKRIFRMAPIHHHFEMSGWKENKIVLVFTATGILLAVLAILSAV